ncbi:MAG: anaerobic ribonucleoside-triphosphate reductase activating protein [Clostridia bacterium]|nr:anaerobic ribonucleoside-triphosphate reductase activating protein [Clostridia bacterium]
MKIMGFYKSTMLDYPDHIASAIFTRQCNYRCPYCHNGDLVLENSDQWDIDETQVIAHLEKRKDILEGLVISGGEPTLSKGLVPFIEKVKALGMKVKLDTNGTNPEMLQSLIEKNQVDYIAMDVKNSLDKYPETAGVSSIDKANILKSIDLIVHSGIDHEFRTTIIKEFHEKHDIINMAGMIKGAKAYYLQQYEPSEKMLAKGPFHFYTVEEMATFKSAIEQYHYVSKVEIRGRF